MTELNIPEPLTRPNSEVDVERFEPEACNMADAYADNLMTELFDDVDRLLSDEPGAIALVEPSGLTAAQGDGWSTGQAGVSTLMPVSGDLDLPQFDGPSPDSKSKHSKLTFRQRWQNRLLNRQLLLGAAGMSVFFTLGLWWLSGQQTTQTPQPTAQPVASPAELQAQADGQFLEYLRRSLDVIESQSSADAAVASSGLTPSLPAVSVNSAPPGSGTTLPPLPGTAAASPGTPNVIERIYVPVYQPPQTVAAAPAVGTAATPASATTASAAASPPNVAPTMTHLLVGVLELGDRSAALFEVNGVPQRIYVGQNIASSGWTLVSVANQEAVIRRNGDVRSVFVGQQF